MNPRDRIKNPQSTVPLSGKATVDALADHWGKLLAITMLKLGAEHVVLTAADIEALGKDGAMDRVIVVQELEDGLHLTLMSPEDAMRKARESKGGFGKS